MSFDKNSNFNREANFTGVKFGESKPVLEVELNELQEIQNEARADIVRDSIPSGFVTLGELDYTYMENNENQVKLKTDSVAYVNGYKISIPKDTIIDIGKAPEKASREDLVFLEVWKEEVTDEDTVTKFGGEGQPVIPNHIKDERYPVALSRRYALKWRIRHVADVDFVSFPTGFTSGTGLSRNPMITSQGARDLPVDVTGSAIRYNFILCNEQNRLANIYDKTDIGLYTSGNYGNLTESKQTLKTLDGYVYAIPMFKLHRKPSCGKSTPLEYSKINPKVDYSKFIKLMSEEKVERVVSENVKGRSLVNLSKSLETEWRGDSTLGLRTYSCDTLIEGKTYTFILIGKPLNSNWCCVFSSTSGGSDIKELFSYTNAPKVCVTLTTDNYNKKLPFNIVHVRNGYSLTPDTELLVLEGDWTNKELPKMFTGLKSLGEDDTNLITVKNGILSDDTYDINDGNQKLISHENITHVNSGNTIIPTIEAKVKRGETELSNLTSLNTKLTTEGNETVEFTKIKGRTLQNLMTKTIGWSSASTVSGSNIIMTNDGITQSIINVKLSQELKPNTTYTVLVNLLESGVKLDSVLYNEEQSLACSTTITHSIGLNRHTYITNSNSATHLRFASNILNGSSSKIHLDIVLIEGDHSNTPLEQIPYIEGIKSVGEAENNVVTVKSMSKNLMDCSKGLANFIQDGDYFKYDYKTNERDTLDLKPNTKYYYSYDSVATNITNPNKVGCMVYDRYGSQIFEASAQYKPTNGKTTGEFTTNNNPPFTINFSPQNGDGNVVYKIQNIQVEELGFTPYTRHTSQTQNIYLKEPLRSLPNGVCDEIVGNKVIRRVVKVVFDGSEPWLFASTGNTARCYLLPSYQELPKKSGKTEGIYCDKFYLVSDESSEVEGISEYHMDSRIYIKINRSKLSSFDIEGFKAWLKENPTTVYYELASPVEEYLENVYEKESIKTYQLDAPLRSLPNGIKDEIKDEVLIRRCGEFLFTDISNTYQSLTWSSNEALAYFSSSLPNLVTNDHISVSEFALVCDKLKVWGWNSLRHDGVSGVAKYTNDAQTSSNLNFAIPLASLSANTIDGFKAWLKANPVKVIYELATPMETILKEVKPQSADFSLERQFADGNYLRELPNGVKDTVENGKVIRRTTKLTLNGSEDWNYHSQAPNQINTIAFYLSGDGLNSDRTSLAILSNTLKSLSASEFDNKDTEGISVGNGSMYTTMVKISRSKLASADVTGFKAWLSANPTTVIRIIKTPIEETLTEENKNYFPSHEFNSYCGSMYVGEGRNYIISDNKMPSEDNIIVNTDFRQIDGNVRVEDCKYKKVSEGYTLIPYGLGKNKFPVAFVDSGTLFYPNLSKSGSVTISFDAVTLNGRCGVYVNDGDVKIDSQPFSSGSISLTFNLPTISNNINFKFLGWDSGSKLVSASNIQLEYGSVKTSYEPYIPGMKPFENTEANDVSDLRHKVSLTGFNYDKLLNESFELLLKGEL